MRLFRKSALVLAVLSGSVPSAHALTFLTEDNRPFNYADGTNVAGMSTEIVKEIARRAGEPASFEVGSWSTMYTRTQAAKDACLYSAAREDRDALFQWVGPIATNTWALYAKEGFKGTVANVKDAGKYRIASVSDDAKSRYLRSRGATFLVEAGKDEENPAKLTTDPKATGGKVDLWVTGAYQAKALAEKAGVKDLKRVYVIRDVELFVACSPRVPKERVKKLNDAFASMQKDGSLKAIHARYASSLLK